MAEPQLDRQRASRLMESASIDALLATSPANFLYATGYRSWVVNLYGRAGYGGAVVPRDPTAGIGVLIPDVEAVTFRRGGPPRHTIVRSYPWWIAYAEVDPRAADADPRTALDEANRDQPAERGGQIERREVTEELARLVRAMGIGERATIGIERAFVGSDVANWLREALPEASWLDGTSIFAELRAIKTPREMALLKLATELTETGIRAAFAAARPGVSARELTLRFRAAVLGAAGIVERDLDVGTMRFGPRVGRDALDPASAGSRGLEYGDSIFVDAGVEVDGYRADMGCTAVVGRASSAQRIVFDALKRGQDAAAALMRPDMPVADVFVAAREAVWSPGLRVYVRGNLGHGIGIDAAPELPIVARDSPHRLVPGMVVSLELPYYVQGLGGFQIEHTYEITERGAARWTTLPEVLHEVG